MNEMPVAVGLLVRDDFGRLGIVSSRKERPSEAWIGEHLHSDEIRKLDASVLWWGVMPLDGGLVLAPEPMIEVIRPTSYENFLEAADNANEAGRTYLATLFPHFVDRALAERADREGPR